MENYIVKAKIAEMRDGGYTIIFNGESAILKGETKIQAVEKAQNVICGLLQINEYQSLDVDDSFIAGEDIYIVVPDVMVAMNRSSKYVKKNLTIPEYLDDAAKEAGINYSELLRESIKTKLGLK